MPYTPALHVSQANALTMALTAQILIAHGLLAADGEAPAPNAAARAATRARARELREELRRLREETRALLRETLVMVMLIPCSLRSWSAQSRRA